MIKSIGEADEIIRFGANILYNTPLGETDTLQLTPLQKSCQKI